MKIDRLDHWRTGVFRALGSVRLAAGLVLVLAAAAARAGEPPADLAAQIDRLVKDAGVTAATPGVGVMVIDKGRVVHGKGYGLARLDDRAPFTAHTTCEIASMTKMFTAMAVLILHDRGKLDLADDVRRFIPEFPSYDRARPVTIAHLLQHTSGLPDYLAFPEPKGKNPGYVVNEDYVGAFARLKDRHPARFAPGGRYHYNNSNYMLLALVVERVSKRSFGDFLRSEVLQPLGMKDSWVYDAPKAAPRVAAKDALNALAYRRSQNAWTPGWGSPPFRDESLLTVGDGGLWTSLDDLARWDRGLREGKLLEPATLKLALTPSTTSDGKKNPYGCGFVLSLDGDRLLTIGHNGGWVFQTCYVRDIVNDRSLILLSNREGFPVDGLRRKIEAALGGP